MNTKAILIFSAVMALAPVAANADMLNDINRTVGQVGKLLGTGNSSSYSSSQTFIQPGAPVALPNGTTGKVYGSDCPANSRSSSGCSYIKVDNSERRVTLVGSDGKAVNERWTFKQITSSKIMAIRPSGDVLYFTN